MLLLLCCFSAATYCCYSAILLCCCCCCCCCCCPLMDQASLRYASLLTLEGVGLPFLAVPRRTPLPQLLCHGRPWACVASFSAGAGALLMLLFCSATAKYGRCTVVLLVAAAAAAAHVCDMFLLLTLMMTVMLPNPSRCFHLPPDEIRVLRNCIPSRNWQLASRRGSPVCVSFVW